MSVELVPVHSSNIAAVGHDPETGDLHVKFKSGDTWVYGSVPAEAHAALIGADSIGKHFHKHVKSKFEGKKHGSSA